MFRDRVLLAIVAAAITVRLLFCFVLFPRYLAEGSTVGHEYFFDSYRQIAATVLEEGRFALSPGGPPAIHRPPGYVALLMAAAPRGEHTRVLFQTYHALLGGLACLVTFMLARTAGVTRFAALIATAVVAFWPFLVWETKVTVPENLVVVLLPLASWALIRSIDSTRLAWAAAAGAIAGISAVTHALHQVLIPAGVMMLVLLSRLPWQRRFVNAIVFALVAAAPVLAWSWRNQAVTGYRGLATGFGHHYWMGIHTYEILRRDPVDYFRDHGDAAGAAVNARLAAAGHGTIDSNEARSDPAKNRFLDATAMEHALANPLFTIGKVAVKAPLAWVQQQSPRRSLLNAVLLLPLILPAIAGALLGGRALVPVWFPVVLLNAGAAFVFVEGAPMRYALPWIPAAAILAAFALERLRLILSQTSSQERSSAENS